MGILPAVSDAKTSEFGRVSRKLATCIVVCQTVELEIPKKFHIVFCEHGIKDQHLSGLLYVETHVQRFILANEYKRRCTHDITAVTGGEQEGQLCASVPRTAWAPKTKTQHLGRSDREILQGVAKYLCKVRSWLRKHGIKMRAADGRWLSFIQPLLVNSSLALCTKIEVDGVSCRSL